MIANPVRCYPMDGQSKERLSIGDRVFQRNGSIFVFNPLYNIELTDPREQIRIGNSNVSKSQVLERTRNRNIAENYWSSDPKQQSPYDLEHSLHRSQVMDQEAFQSDQPLTKSLVIKKTAFPEDQQSQIFSKIELDKKKRMDQFYQSEGWLIKI